MPARELAAIHDVAQAQAKHDQEIPAFTAWVLGRNPYVGGMKDLDLDDMYTGLARGKVAPAPYSPSVMRGITTAIDLEETTGRLFLSQAHLDLLDSYALTKWLTKRRR